MYTAKDARKKLQNDLDDRIKDAVENWSEGPNSTYMRVYRDDQWLPILKEELEKRGFTNIIIPDIVLSGDVYFEWPLED